jgi:uroporphyrinogen-III synthase
VSGADDAFMRGTPALVAITRPLDPEHPCELTLHLLASPHAHKLCVQPLPLIQNRYLDFPAPIVPAGGNTLITPTYWTFFTSPRAVKAVTAIPPALDYIRRGRIAVLGLAEARAVMACGMQVDWQSSQSSGAQAAQQLADVAFNQAVWWPCAADANPDTADALKHLTPQLRSTPVYETIPVHYPEAMRSQLSQSVRVWVFTSPSAVRQFTEQGFSLADGAVIACLGKTTQAALRLVGLPFPAFQPETPSLAGLATAILRGL